MRAWRGTAAVVAACLGAAGVAGDPPNETAAYVRALQENQYLDLAVDYLRLLEQRPDTPPALKARLNFDVAAALMDLAEAADPETEAKAHDEASVRFRKLLAGNPDRTSALEARNHLAYVLLKRAQRGAGLAEAAADPPKQAALRAAARTQFEAARKEFADTVAECRQAALAAKPGSRAPDALVQARMNQAMVEYQSARAYDAAAPERKAALAKAEKLFAEVAHDTGAAGVTFASVYAKLFEGKALSDAGNHRDAIDVLEEVVVNERIAGGKSNAAFRALLTRARLALYQAFNAAGKPGRIVAEPAYAVKEWLERNAVAARSHDGMGVQLEAAKAYLALGGKLPEGDRERARLMGLAALRLTAVARSSAPFAREAFRLREANAAALKAVATAPTTFDEALQAAALLRDNGKNAEAAAAFAAALGMASAKADPEQLADAWFGIVLGNFRANRHAEAVAAAEQLFAERPTAKRTPFAADLALASHYQLYRGAGPGSRPERAARALAFAQAVEARYPALAVADGARRLQGYLLLGMQKFPEAAAAFGAAAPAYQGYGECQLRQAQCLLRDYDALARAKTPDATKLQDAGARILTALRNSSAAQRADLAKAAAEAKSAEPKAAPLPALLVEAETTQAELLLRTGAAKEASALADPLAPVVVAADRKDLEPFVGRVLVAALDAASAQRDFPKADALVERLVQQRSDTPGKVTGVLVRLGQGLEKQWQGHVAAGRTAEAEATHNLLRRYLERFAARPQQDYRGARHAADGFAAIGLHAEAAAAYGPALAALAGNPPEIPAGARAQEGAFLRLRQAEAYRKAGQPEKAKPLLEKLLAESAAASKGFALRQRVEYARILQAAGERDPSQVAAAMAEWNQIQNVLAARRGPKADDYFEARLGIGWCFWQQGKPADAAKFLKATMALNPGVGGPAMLARYEALLQQLGK